MTTDPIAAARALLERLTGYTPGPWYSDTSVVGTMIDDRYEWSSIAIPGDVDRHHKSENAANARLIAAAPDLLATLAIALDEIDRLRAERGRHLDTLRTETGSRDLSMTSALEKWKAQLRDDGKAALRTLLNGTASLGRLSAAEPEDAVDAILASEPHDSDIIRGFDRGCAELLEEFRSTLLQLEGRSFRIELAKLVTLVTIIRRLLPEQTVSDLHRRYFLWSDFFENFVVDRGLDLRREYFRILALSQDVTADHAYDDDTEALYDH